MPKRPGKTAASVKPPSAAAVAGAPTIRSGTAALMRTNPEMVARWAEEERVDRVNAVGWLQELERYYESLPSLPSTDLRRHQILYEIWKARQGIGDTSQSNERPFEKKWVAQCEHVRLFHERISLEWATHTVRGFGIVAAARKAHPDTDEKYREYVKQICEMMNANALSLTSAIQAVARARNNPRISESTLWRAWERFGPPAK